MHMWGCEDLNGPSLSRTCTYEMSISVRMLMHGAAYSLSGLNDDAKENIVSFLNARERQSTALAGPITEHPYAVYRRYTLARRQRRAAEKERAQTRIAIAQSVGKKTRLRYCLDVLEYPLGLGAYGLGAFATVLLLLLKLNGTYPDLPWVGVLAPPVLLGVVFALSVCIGACTSFCSAHCPSRSLCAGQRDASEDSIYHFISKFGSAAADRVPRRRPCCRSFCRCSAWMWVLVLAGLLLVALPTMVALKLQGWTVLSEASWAVTLLPLWVAFGWWCLLPVILRSGDGFVVFFASMVFYVPLIIVAAIAVARVDGVHFTSVAAMLSPFWLLDLCAICVLFYFCLMACFDDDDRVAGCFATWTAAAVFGTLLIPQVWAAVADAQGLPFPVNGVFGPIAAFVGLAALANCACALAMFMHSRRHHYENAYSRRVCRRVWCGCCLQADAEQAPVIVVMNTLATARVPVLDVGDTD